MEGEHAQIRLVRFLSEADKDHLDMGKQMQQLVGIHDIKCCHILEDGDGHLHELLFLFLLFLNGSLWSSLRINLTGSHKVPFRCGLRRSLRGSFRGGLRDSLGH